MACERASKPFCTVMLRALVVALLLTSGMSVRKISFVTFKGNSQCIGGGTITSMGCRWAC